ncbi:Fic family protein [Desulfovibrio inopinatus]|uniref:Fic family protein n=1 Tax=Desulfovibrio inopinatus TaxID=102109 RepID=UPI0004238E0D|nr:Fic family protein [Desulfovibrio inopinatus]
MLTVHQMEPLVPTRREELQALSLAIYKASAKIAGRVHPRVATRICTMLRHVNSYYSNLIEGIRTTLLDIESGLVSPSKDEETRRLQQLHKQHIAAQTAIEQDRLLNAQDITSATFLCRLHGMLFEKVPREFLIQRDKGGTREVITVPGQFRHDVVQVGRHIPPDDKDLSPLLQRFHDVYSLGRVKGVERLITAAASHHRLLWIHPFLEGNGRVARLFSDLYLKYAELDGYGLWTMSRGLARAEEQYKLFLSAADARRQGDYDGRGNLSEKGLYDFCVFFLETALDQACFMDALLHLDSTVKNIELYCTVRNKGYMAKKVPLPKEASRILVYVFTYGQLSKGSVHEVINCSDRKARDIVKLLLAEGLLETENQKAPLEIGLPPDAVQFYFPELCDSGAF